MAAPHQEARVSVGGVGCSLPPVQPRPALVSLSAHAQCHSPQHQSRGVSCRGYVGQGAMSAREYHECDFDWHEHAAAVRHIVEAQQAQALAMRLQQQPDADAASTAGMHPSPGKAQQLQQSQPREAQPVVLMVGRAANNKESPTCAAPSQAVAALSSRQLPSPTQSWCTETSAEQAAGAAAAGAMANTAAIASGTSPTVSVQTDAAGRRHAEEHQVDHGRFRDSSTSTSTRASRSSYPRNGSKSRSSSGSGSGGGIGTQTEPRRAGGDAAAVYEGDRWEDFYRAHPTARFFKERRYLLLEFPELLQAQHVAEIGCGCGSSILPVLKANAAARTTCTDISVTCLAQLHEAATAEGIAPSRICVFPADATDPEAAPAFDGIDADALLIMFTLSAVTPEQQRVMLSHAWRALRPGGRLMLRDHGLYDMVQLRIPASQWVGPNLYKRGDGTMAFFFSTEELSSRAAAAGFRTVECKYVTVTNRNRKTGVELRRVFVHGVFEKPTSM